MAPQNTQPHSEEEIVTQDLSVEAKRRQRMRSWAIAGVLLFLVVAFYAATIVRLGGNVLNRPM